MLPTGAAASSAAAASDSTEVRARLADACLTLRAAAALPDPEYLSLFRGGGLPLGYYGIIHGPGGIGKTREALRMIVLRTLGKRWHAWEPTDEPLTTLILSFEMGRAFVARLLEKIAHDLGEADAWELVADRIHIVGAPEFLGPFHAGLSTGEDLIGVIKDFGVNLVLIDSASEILGGHGGDTPEDYAPMVGMLKSVARSTNAHLCVIHHNRRLPAGARSQDAPADQIRGPASFVNASRWACAMDAYHGKTRITWHRVSFGAKPDASFFELDRQGIPRDAELGDERSNAGKLNRAKVLAAITAVGGLSRVAIQQATDLSESAVGEHLKHLVKEGVIVRAGSGRNISYVLPSSRAPEFALPGSST